MHYLGEGRGGGPEDIKIIRFNFSPFSLLGIFLLMRQNINWRGEGKGGGLRKGGEGIIEKETGQNFKVDRRLRRLVSR
jgi:hypothetical protein